MAESGGFSTHFAILTWAGITLTMHQFHREGHNMSIHDFTPPPPRRNRPYEHLFTTKAVRRVQAPAETHEYKKEQGSSDGSHTYDTTAI
jgi:hypothetical protein